MASVKEVMKVMLPQIESMMDQKVEGIKSMLSKEVADILAKNQMLNDDGEIKELKTAKDKKLDQLVEDILETRTKNPTAGLVITTGAKGRKQMVDTYSDVLADIQDERDARYKMRRTKRM